MLAIFTSGTTGKLKAVQHTQASYAGIVLNILLNLPDIRRGDVMLHAASLIHASGTFVVPYWLRGGASAVLPGFDPRSYFDAIEKWRPAALNMVPTMLGMLLEQTGAADITCRRCATIIYGASPMPRPVIKRALDLWGPRFLQYYGQTEAPLFPHASAAPRIMSAKTPYRRAARLRPAERGLRVRLVDPDGNDVPSGESGEIALRAPFQMKGYLDEPELNQATFLPGGFIRTRDVGRFDEARLSLSRRPYLRHDRHRRLQRLSARGRGGARGRTPRWREGAVVGIPDDKWVEAVAAFVRSAKTRSVGGSRHHRLRAGQSLPATRCRRSVHFINDVPKSPVGKLLRRAVRDPFWAGRERRIG